MFCFIFYRNITKSAIHPFTDHDWTIEKIDSANDGVILADSIQINNLKIAYFDFVGYYFILSGCDGVFSFDDSNQEFDFLFYGCIITPNHTDIADYFINDFIMQEAGMTTTPEGFVYGPFSYNFTYSDNGDAVYLHIDNQAGSVATFFAANLSQDEFLKESITIFPNPVSEVLNIKSSSIPIEKVKVYDINGRLALEINSNSSEINVSALQKGVYILNAETSAGILREKLVKN